ncbi:type I restriction enzyme HsdR N-terminal domain-containing protein [Streptomonospora sp. S1-112]|uniref:Type I restriction enzyme HsdR N-terminal domain-containing protein n=1 Tax=Streptomonospora mangrovi TaxID=2883123 RepID=A0A9X3NTK2_9ACTN|nr:type I restriction endonuclease [Streptomonospora mangrovi]MDA0567759.1 type I restriction enzyme HsdR N-terminal domain-containing protein [Streptomonospora mangrovi]
MEFSERLSALAAKVRNQREAITTEEATKNAFVMPFISSILGYDVFDPLEVVPEYTADVGTKKGEKVDYAIMRDGEVQILIECKKSVEPLAIEHAAQLYRYFSVTNARIAVLTNGEVYRFYTDLDEPNRMDRRPFLVLDLNDIDETLVPELRKLTKEAFDLDSVISAAGELKYIGEIKRALAAQFREPDDDWIRLLTARVYDRSFTKKVRDQFAPLVAKAAAQYLNDQVNSRLKTALGSGVHAPAAEEAEVTSAESAAADLDRDTGITTTLEELEGYQIVKAIACSEVKPQRITHRDSKSYFAVLLDDNNRKTIARLHFNGKSRRYLGVFDAEKNETRHLIESPDDIYLHAEAIRSSVRNYLAD